MELHCSFCGKGKSEVEKLIAGLAVFICDECVGLCVDILEAKPPTGGKQRAGKVRQYMLARDVGQVLIRVPDGSVHAGEPTTPWRPLVVDGEKLEWCTARSPVRGSTPLLVVAVRRRGADGPAVGAAFGTKTKPTRVHAKEIAVKYLLGRRMRRTSAAVARVFAGRVWWSLPVSETYRKSAQQVHPHHRLYRRL